MNRSTTSRASWFLACGLLACFQADAQAPCLEISGAQVTAGDLAASFPQLRVLPAATPFGFAPPVGASRIISGRELAAWADQHGRAVDINGEVCVTRASQSLSETQIRTAITKALDRPEVEVSVIAFDRKPLPQGRLEFNLGDARRPPRNQPEAPCFWLGRVIATDGRAYPVWAQVRAVTKTKRVRLSCDVTAQHLLESACLEEFETQQSAFAPVHIARAQDFLDRITRRALRLGTVLETSDVAVPPQILRGQIVTVEARSGVAVLKLTARADASGNAGQIIPLTNLDGPRHFRGVVESAGLVRVDVPGASIRTEGLQNAK